MTYKDLFDGSHEYCQTEVYSGTAIRLHAFVAGAEWVIKCLSTIPDDEVVDEVVELYEELKQEEELKKWTLKKMTPTVPNECRIFALELVLRFSARLQKRKTRSLRR